MAEGRHCRPPMRHSSDLRQIRSARKVDGSDAARWGCEMKQSAREKESNKCPVFSFRSMRSVVRRQDVDGGTLAARSSAQQAEVERYCNSVTVSARCGDRRETGRRGGCSSNMSARNAVCLFVLEYASWTADASSPESIPVPSAIAAVEITFTNLHCRHSREPHQGTSPA